MPKGYSVNPEKDKRGLTKQQAVFVDKSLEVGPVEAARIAYPDAKPECQEAISRENLHKPDIVHSISKQAELLGLRKENCIETIKDGLTATRLFGKEGIEHADHPSRLKAAELGLKLHGELKNDSQGAAVQMTKDVFVELCAQFWASKPK